MGLPLHWEFGQAKGYAWTIGSKSSKFDMDEGGGLYSEDYGLPKFFVYGTAGSGDNHSELLLLPCCFPFRRKSEKPSSTILPSFDTDLDRKMHSHPQ